MHHHLYEKKSKIKVTCALLC